MKKESNVFESIIAFIIMLFVGFFITAYGVVVIQDIAKWYDVPLTLNFRQIFGSCLIIDLVIIKAKDLDDKSEKGTWSFMRTYMISATMTTLSWGIAYLFHFVV